VKSGWSDSESVNIVLEEKNLPPVTDEDADKKITSNGFEEITITDFPIRGTRAQLTFRRRYWQVEGKHQLLKRDIELCTPGTQLETEFANFLKEKGRRDLNFARLYRDVV
jgi:hypothetical protein